MEFDGKTWVGAINFVFNCEIEIKKCCISSTVPMIFMDLCDAGSLTNWVQLIHFVSPAIKDAMVLFSQDIICGLEHLHGLKV